MFFPYCFIDKSYSLGKMYLHFNNANTYTESYMKKIQISQFRKKYGPQVYDQLRTEVNKNCYENMLGKNSAVNINKIIQCLPESDIKIKFSRWASGYDFAIFDVG